MCKILAIAGVRPEDDAKLWTFVKAASAPMVGGNDRDGYGYAALTHDGKLYGEKWADVGHRFKKRAEVGPAFKPYTSAFGSAVAVPCGYKMMGNIEGEIGTTATVIAHARQATCGRELANVHPFMRANTALVHNGVITNTQAHPKVVSSCDSESILSLYLTGMIEANPAAFQKSVVEELQGSYAAFVLTPTCLDVFRNDGAVLYVAQITALDAWAFATTPEIILAGAKAIKSGYGPVVAVRSGHFIRLDPIAGEVIQHQEFTDYDGGWNRTWPTPTKDVTPHYTRDAEQGG
jgi:predicted glutamine amidotransferase